MVYYFFRRQVFARYLKLLSGFKSDDFDMHDFCELLESGKFLVVLAQCEHYWFT